MSRERIRESSRFKTACVRCGVHHTKLQHEPQVMQVAQQKVLERDTQVHARGVRDMLRAQGDQEAEAPHNAELVKAITLCKAATMSTDLTGTTP